MKIHTLTIFILITLGFTGCGREAYPTLKEKQFISSTEMPSFQNEIEQEIAPLNVDVPMDIVTPGDKVVFYPEGGVPPYSHKVIAGKTNLLSSSDKSFQFTSNKAGAVKVSVKDSIGQTFTGSFKVISPFGKESKLEDGPEINSENKEVNELENECVYEAKYSSYNGDVHVTREKSLHYDVFGEQGIATYRGQSIGCGSGDAFASSCGVKSISVTIKSLPGTICNFGVKLFTSSTNPLQLWRISDIKNFTGKIYCAIGSQCYSKDGVSLFRNSFNTFTFKTENSAGFGVFELEAYLDVADSGYFRDSSVIWYPDFYKTFN